MIVRELAAAIILSALLLVGAFLSIDARSRLDRVENMDSLIIERMIGRSNELNLRITQEREQSKRDDETLNNRINEERDATHRRDEYLRKRIHRIEGYLMETGPMDGEYE